MPGYDRRHARIGIVHFGPGAFHRAHQASYVDTLLHADPRWAISAVALRSSAVRDALAPQECLYTLAELGELRRVRILGSIREVLAASETPQAVFKRLMAPETRLVTLTVTEKGYCLNGRSELDDTHVDIAHDLANPRTPRSAIGWLVEGLRRRRARGIAPFTAVSCDNLSDNGRTLHKALVAFAASLDRELARWIDAEVACPNTMVDSITPATDAALLEFVVATTGLADAWPVQREPFVQWVVENSPAMREADWESAGVTLATAVGAYERAKLRLLNGAHSTLAYVGLLRGHETVLDAMGDPPLVNFVERLMREDIAASLTATSEIDMDAYIDAVLKRFRNPGISHRLSQIAWDGSKKLPMRLIGTIEDALRGGRSIAHLALPIAAWMRCVARQAKAGVPLVDPEAAVLADAGRACTGEAAHDVGLLAGVTTAIPASLAAQPIFRRAVETAYEQLPKGRIK